MQATQKAKDKKAIYLAAALVLEIFGGSNPAMVSCPGFRQGWVWTQVIGKS
jgi:hypothetical protein